MNATGLTVTVTFPNQYGIFTLGSPVNLLAGDLVGILFDTLTTTGSYNGAVTLA